MNRKIILCGFLALLMTGVLYLTVYPQVQGTPPLVPGQLMTAPLQVAHKINPPFPYVYYYIGQSFLDMAAVSSPWSWTYRGYPVWAMDYQDTASSNIFAFPEGANKAYIGVIPLLGGDGDSIHMTFGFETRNTFANFGATYGTLTKNWYQVGTKAIAGKTTNDSLQKAILGFPTKVLGNQWRLTATTNHSNHAGIFDSTDVVAAQVAFGFPGDKQYFVQYYPDPDLSDEVGGDLFQVRGPSNETSLGAGVDTSYTCRAPAFTTFNLFAHPTALGTSLKVYVVLEAKRLKGLTGPESAWNRVDSLYLDGAADSVGEVLVVNGITKAFFDEYRIHVHGATGNDSSSTTSIKIFGVFNP